METTSAGAVAETCAASRDMVYHSRNACVHPRTGGAGNPSQNPTRSVVINLVVFRVLTCWLNAGIARSDSYTDHENRSATKQFFHWMSPWVQLVQLSIWAVVRAYGTIIVIGRDG